MRLQEVVPLPADTEAGREAAVLTPEGAGAWLHPAAQNPKARQTQRPRLAEGRTIMSFALTPRISCRAGCKDLNARKAFMPARSTATVR